MKYLLQMYAILDTHTVTESCGSLEYWSPWHHSLFIAKKTTTTKKTWMAKHRLSVRFWWRAIILQSKRAACDTWSRLKAYHYLPCHHVPFSRYVAANLVPIAVDKLFQRILLFHPLAQNFFACFFCGPSLLRTAASFFLNLKVACQLSPCPFSAFSAATIPSPTQSLYVNLASISVWLCFFCYSFSVSLLVRSAWVKSNWISFDPPRSGWLKLTYVFCTSYFYTACDLPVIHQTEGRCHQ